MIYLDYCANTPADPAVLERFCAVERQCIGNANSSHTAGRAAETVMVETGETIAALLGVQPKELIYTSGASEANNLAIKGLTHAQRHVGKHIISTPLEHPSVSAPLTALQERGYEIDLVNIGADGRIDLEHFRALLRRDTVLTAVCAVDSELGVVQPVAEIAEILKAYPDCRLHVDATQAIGKTPIARDGVDTLCLSGHKFYGLLGSGLLYKRSGVILEPLIHCGSSTTLYRSGTPTTALNAALARALELTVTALDMRIQQVQAKNDALRQALSAYPKVQLNSPEHAVPHILNLSVQGVKGAAFQKALDARGVCVSVKSACSSDALPSRAVFAVSRDRKRALNAWRISLSHLTTDEEIREFLQIFDTCYRELTA